MQCYIPEEFYEAATMRSFLQVPNALDVVYEDDAVLLINKPKGLRAHSDTCLLYTSIQQHKYRIAGLVSGNQILILT